MSPLPGKQSDLWTQVGYYSSLGIILPACAMVGYGVGWLLDRWLHTAPVLSVVLTLGGAAGGFVELLQLLKRAENRDSRDNSGPGAS